MKKEGKKIKQKKLEMKWKNCNLILRKKKFAMLDMNNIDDG